MSEWLVIAAIVVAGASGLPGVMRRRDADAGTGSAMVLIAIASCLGIAGGVAALAGWSAELAAPWPVPGGRLSVHVDPISAVFVIQIALISGLGAVYGKAYWPQRQHIDNARKLRLFYGLVTAGMLLLVTATNAMLFLVGWEFMAVAAFVLLMIEDEKQEVRAVSYLYMAATRLGTLAIFAMFGLLWAASGTLDFTGWRTALESPFGAAAFVLGLIGFGLKAGAMPLHVWLPGAHASAPSHVSALMSGVLIKMGIYGIVRLTSLCDHPPLWWGYTLLAVGTVSGALGVGFAIAQHDLKRLLAYHSVENIGIICLGMGVALLGRSLHRDDLAVLGVAGAVLHTWNHGLFKALLFMGAGSVLHATGTRDIDRLGGLWRRMPRTGMTFLIGAIAICGLPPLNGLISELLVYLGLFRTSLAAGGKLWLAGALCAPILALIGALALACFVKVFGAVFLGEPRSPDTAAAHEVTTAMVMPMAALAALCLAIGIGAPLLTPVLDQIATAWLNRPPSLGVDTLAPLSTVSLTSSGLLCGLVVIGWWLAVKVRPARREVGTWDCGYAAPTARMQYTSSSFAQMVVGLLRWVLRPRVHRPGISAVFPRPARFHSDVPDTVLDRGVLPVFHLAGRLAARMRPLQRGNVHLYLFYIVATLIALLLWR